MNPQGFFYSASMITETTRTKRRAY